MCHDVNDIFLEAAKMARYAERKAVSTAIFVVFLLSWILSRLTYFPLFVIRSAWHEPIDVQFSILENQMLSNG